MYSYLTDNNGEDKNTKGSKRCVIKRKLKFDDYKHFLEATELENRINHLQQNNLDNNYLRKIMKNSLKNKKIILKSQQRFKSEKQYI